MGINVPFDYEKVIPKAIPMKRAKEPKVAFNSIHPSITTRIEADASKTSKLFREKIEADRKRLGLS